MSGNINRDDRLNSVTPGRAGTSPSPAAAAEPSMTATASAQRPGTNAGSGTRGAKRNRYISLACNECKRRKIKCNGQTPCQRCGHLNLECLYAPNCCNFKDTEEFRSMRARIETLEAHVNTLYSNVNDLYHKRDGQSIASNRPSIAPDGSLSADKAHVAHSSPHSSSLRSESQQPPLKRPRFHGPTSNAFNFDVARSSLQTMGITNPTDENIRPPEDDQTNTQLPSFPQLLSHPSKDPLWTIGRPEVLRIMQAYAEQVHVMYPILDMKKAYNHANLLFNFIEAADRTGLAMRSLPGADGLYDDDTCILKLLLAASLLAEKNGESEMAGNLFSSVKDKVMEKIFEPADLKSLQLLFLTSIYYFLIDEDMMAFRFAGVTGRTCLEMGLHRNDGVARAFPDEQERSVAINLFWSVYTLDRRFSFGTGLPFTFQDEDLTVPEPSKADPYIRTMVPFYRIGSRVWYSGLGMNGALQREHIGFLDYQLLQWMKSIPPELRYDPNAPADPNIQRHHLRLRIIVYMRANHGRMLLYRPVLHSAESIATNMTMAQTCIDIAKDTINVLTQANRDSDIFESIQAIFNYFLVASLAVLFLAISHAPDHFGAQVRDHFYMALDLVKEFSQKSYVSKRLWKVLRNLHEVGRKLGLLNVQPTDTRPTTMAPVHTPELTADGNRIAMTMADSTSQLGSAALYNGTMPIASTGVTVIPMASNAAAMPVAPAEFGNELLNFFETMGAYGGFNMGSLASAGPNVQHENDVALGSVEGLGEFTGDGDLSRIMREGF